jgi:5-methyltetrahydropteroyltriglutamate--homocysteine methyltransferase
LKEVPESKTVVLGLVCTKKATLETREYLTRRIQDASRFFALEQLALSPSAEVQRTKLHNLVETAKTVWG